MNEVFNPEGRLYQVLLKVYEIVALHVLFVVTSVPLVTIGAATTATYATWFRIWNGVDDGKLVRTFFREFRSNFRKSTILWLVMAAVVAVCAWLVYPVAVAPAIRAFPPLSLAAILLVTVAALAAGYLFPLLARFENSVWRTVLNAFVIAMTNMAASVAVCVINFGILVGGFVFAGRFVVLWLFGAVGVASFLSSWILNRVFAAYLPAEEPSAAS
ncbi:MAG: DUF624 domain-containing protein [Microbacteriaceae bacterium]|nr:DUF624 domain-containing protein [Microbacteriaceae bacterium]MCL2793714.1 DUF624 domain-containing protein [Microbacteriaceae bacterium]